MKILKKLKSLNTKIDKHQSKEEIFNNWVNIGRPSPPPHSIKQLTILEFKQRYNYDIFIETGTFLGDMVEAQKINFEKVYSIELGEDLFNKATKRFKNDSNVTILHGDSGKILKELMPQINNNAIFWLDGHYSAGITAKGEKICPVFEELTAIFNNKPFNHIILIDDARLFIGEDDYPTFNELYNFVKNHKPNADIYYKHDIIHVLL